MNTSFRSIAGWTILLLLLIQFIPLGRINPPATDSFKAPQPIQRALKTACYDCHSYETRWPKAAYIAPASWVIFRTVSAGRSALNFSEWEGTKSEKTDNLREAILQTVEQGTAHQRLYYLLKPDSVLSPRERGALITWLKASLVQP
ncbi:MAG: heme-binding domain-containing protein [Chlorobium sp.]|nr:heme-binding domain-containing protein [Chlorobium sp.]